MGIQVNHVIGKLSAKGKSVLSLMQLFGHRIPKGLVMSPSDNLGVSVAHAKGAAVIRGADDFDEVSLCLSFRRKGRNVFREFQVPINPLRELAANLEQGVAAQAEYGNPSLPTWESMALSITHSKVAQVGEGG